MSSWANIKAVAKRELMAYFASPVAYVFIVIFLLLTGFFTFMLGGFFERDQAALNASFFMWHPWLYLFLVPAAGMRLWSEERRLGTMELLLTMPITAWQAIIGKFLASWIFLAIALVLTFPIVLTVNYLGSPDNGVILSSYVGSLLLAGAYLSVSCMTSAMTRNQVISFILSVVICFMLILVGFAPVTNFLNNVIGLGTSAFGQKIVETVTAFSVMTHFDGFQRGVVDSRDIIFFFSVMGVSLFTTGVILRGHRSG
jgi:ABC-2 type transport system permease protein